jgi:DAACS family dicarboxylate/amino acid:cation (Na+ or H+) symporter
MALQVVIAVVVAIPLGLLLGVDGARAEGMSGGVRTALAVLIQLLAMLPKIVLKALTAVGAPLVLLAIVTAITTNDIPGRKGLKMMLWYVLNTLFAITVGLTLSLVIRPGAGAVIDVGALVSSGPPRLAQVLVPIKIASEPPASLTLRDLIMDLVPRSLGDALVRNHIAQIAFIGLAVGITLARMKKKEAPGGPASHLVGILTILFDVAVRILNVIVAFVPAAVLGVVAIAVAYTGFGIFSALGRLILTVLVGLSIQFVWYLVLLGVRSRVSPLHFVRSLPDVISVAFSSSSSTATLPRTLDVLQNKLGVSRASSQLAACVGTNFNNDGTALYQGAVAIFFAQAAGVPLHLAAAVALALATIVAAFGAGGIPSGSFITLPLTFALVGIPIAGLPVLLTVDWFLDRCRTSVNVAGDMTVAVLIDRDGGAEPARPPS